MEKSDSDAHEQTVIIASVFILPETLSIKFHALDCISNDCYGCYGPSQSSIVSGRGEQRQAERSHSWHRVTDLHMALRLSP